MASIGPGKFLCCELSHISPFPPNPLDDHISDAYRTNITEPVKKYNTSRGYLVSSFLQSDSPRPLDEIGKIIPMNEKFAGFNLLLLAPTPDTDSSIQYDSLYITNHGGGGTLTSRPLRPSERSCGGISNGIDGAGAESWFKVQHATKEFEAVLQTLTPNDDTASELTDRLFKLLAWVSFSGMRCLYPRLHL